MNDTLMLGIALALVVVGVLFSVVVLAKTKSPTGGAGAVARRHQATLRVNGQPFSVDHSPFLIGRAVDNMAVHLCNYTSNFHARMDLRGGRWYIVDGKWDEETKTHTPSKNLTTLNGIRVEQEPVEVCHQDFLKFADRDVGEFEYTRRSRDLPTCARYELLHVLNQAGAMSAIYVAKPINGESAPKNVALKVSRPYRGEDTPDRVARFRREHRFLSLAHASNPGMFPAVYGDLVPMDNKEAGIAMELLEGVTLERRMRRLDLGKRMQLAIQLGLDLGGCLSALQILNIVHADIKPENIIALPDDTFRLIDFGIAIDSGQHGGAFKSLDYCSPERLRREPLDPRSDVYSLGCVLYRLIKGSHPFHGWNSPEELKNRHLSSDPPNLEDGHTQPQAVAACRIVMQMLSKDQAGRPTPEAFLARWRREVAQSV